MLRELITNYKEMRRKDEEIDSGRGRKSTVEKFSKSGMQTREWIGGAKENAARLLNRVCGRELAAPGLCALEAGLVARLRPARAASCGCGAGCDEA